MRVSNVSTTQMSSKGQVVIPEEIRESLHLEIGEKFIVLGSGDSIILKKIKPIPKKDINALLKSASSLAKKYNLKKSDISKTIKEVRQSKRNKDAGITT